MMQELSDLLTAIERTAWQLRGISDEVVRMGVRRGSGRSAAPASPRPG